MVHGTGQQKIRHHHAVVFAIPDVRLCRFIAILLDTPPPPPPAAACVTLTRAVPVDNAPPLTVLDDTELDCDRGRDVEDAILGSAPPLRKPLLELPEARFLERNID